MSDLRRAIEQAGAQELARRLHDPRLRPAPQLARLPDGQVVAILSRIDQVFLITAAPLLAHLLRQAAMVIPDEYPDLRADINRCLRQIAGG